MKKLLVLSFALSLFAGCAVVTPYGTSLYVPVPELAVAPYPYAYSYYPYPYPYYHFGYPWYGWRPGWGCRGCSYRFDGHRGPPGHGRPPGGPRR